MRPPPTRPPQDPLLVSPEPSSATLVPTDEDELPGGAPDPASPGAHGHAPRALPDQFEGPVPDYLRGVPQAPTVRRTETIGALPSPPPARRRFPVLAVVAGLLSLAVVAPSSVAGFGAYQVRASQTRLRSAERTLAERMDNDLRLRDELALLGADRAPLDEAFTAWARTAQDPERADLAVAFVDLAEAAVRSNVGLSDRSHEALQVRARLERLTAARAELAAARGADASVRGAVPAQVAAALGWVSP